MDDQVKARLIGATVLVVLAVLLIPELLSGPRRHGATTPATSERTGTRSVTIELDSSGAGRVRSVSEPAADAANSRLPTLAPAQELPARTASAASQPSASSIVPPPGASPEQKKPVGPTSAGPMPGPTAGKRMPADSQPAPSDVVKPAAPVAKPAVPTVKGGWAVQVGAFGAVASASKLVADLRRAGLAAYVAPLERGGKTLHRVRVGPEPTRGAAEQLATRLQARGLPAAVVAAD